MESREEEPHDDPLRSEHLHPHRDPRPSVYRIHDAGPRNVLVVVTERLRRRLQTDDFTSQRRNRWF